MAGDDGLSDGATEGEHCKAAVLQLGGAHLLLALLIAGEELGEAVVAGNLQGVPLEDLLCAAELQDADPEPEQRWRSGTSAASKTIVFLIVRVVT